MRLIKYSLLIVSVVFAVANARIIEILKKEVNISIFLGEIESELNKNEMNFSNDLNEVDQQFDGYQVTEQSAVSISGGSTATQGQFPWMVSLRCINSPNPKCKDNQHFCGGAILSDRFILTAAHCMFGKKGRETIHSFYAAVGTIRIDDGTRYDLKEIIVYPQFNADVYQYDIALLQTVNKIVFTDHLVASIGLPQENTPEKEKLTVSGWGYLNDKKKRPSSLQFVTAYSVSMEPCNSWYGKPLSESQQICADYKKRKNACKGDSGGPLVNSKKEVVGIVSFGPECGHENLTIYTRVFSFLSWITQQMHKYESYLENRGNYTKVDQFSNTFYIGLIQRYISVDQGLFLGKFSQNITKFDEIREIDEVREI